MLGINGLELVVLAIIAIVVLGPERLPEYASQLARLVKGLRRMATGAREQLREEVGPELDEVDWRKLDPRQYDPRRIIREALLDDIEDVFKPVSEGAPTAVAATAPAAALGAARASLSVPVGPRLGAGQAAPYDLEAT
ncbi:Sec-independent protein translocase TatB [Arthrobacter agilis]|uniref:twin-arginine translocase TatA/TatE family subunit n=1 Tax=Arthrobacter agilis TaxID=37921 RepID=UPI000B35BF1D|nr:twin-arginine translocase TatA/TatE family subunit [Arthrobacter agilis]OUM41376.1 Sec-independent protein translocase TatB [Arthrobacter agilis]PPB46292.1 Sec-independent protein translocase TatB [Arthrobacter agilis]TPV27049.1 Sec-independent protein translocase TatB [Arthrobacter agilis]VDR32801.1 Sec-independent protein translocase protein TatB [Arthrobacter agilis]